jgi:hypothetical protein
MKRQKTALLKTTAAPDNLFITVSEIAIRIPFITGNSIGIGHNERFNLIRPDWRTLVFERDPKGSVVGKHYRHTMMFYGRLTIAENEIKLGRYNLCQEQTTANVITFKLNTLWI